MPTNYRFRKNWLGQLILQIQFRQLLAPIHPDDPGDSILVWRDANNGDFNNSFFDRRKA